MMARWADLGMRIWKEKKHGVCALVLMPGMAAAGEVWRCDLEGTALRFELDRNDLWPGIEGEPPRRVLGRADVDGARMRPEVFAMPDGTVGFHEDAGEVGQRMLVISPEGQALYSDTGSGASRSGLCERVR